MYLPLNRISVRMSTIKKQTVTNLLYSYLGVATGFITQIFLIPAFLTTEQNGLLGVLLAYSYLLIQLSSLGFNTAGNKFFPMFRSPENGHKGFLFIGLIVSLVGFILASTLFLAYQNGYFDPFFRFIQPNFNRTHSPLFSQFYYLIFPLSLGSILFNLFDNYAKNLYNTTWGTFLSQFVQRFLQMLVVGLMAFHLFNFEQFLWLWTIGFIFHIIPMVLKCIQLEGFSLRPNFEVFTPTFTKNFIQFSSLTIFTGFSTMIVQYIDKIMLEQMVGLKETGIYTTSLYFISVMGMSLGATNKASIPVISDALHKNDHSSLFSIYQKSCLTQLIFGLLIYLLIIINFDAVFSITQNKDYLLGKYIVIIFGFGKLFDLATGLNGTILLLCKYYKYETYSMVGLIFLTIILNLLLIPSYGMLGAAIVASIATIYFNLFRFLVVWKKLDLQPFNFNFIKVVGVGLIGGLFTYLIPSDVSSLPKILLSIFLKSSFLTIFYIFAIYRMKLSAEMNELIETNLKKIGINL